MKNLTNILLCILLSLSASGAVNAQEDSLKMTSMELSYEDGKKILLYKSFRVLAEYYNVSLAETEMTLAKTWANPNFVWNADMYSHEWNEYFQMGNQTLVQVEYLVYLGGKRVFAKRMAEVGIDMAEYAFMDVVRGIVMEYSELYTSLHLLEERSKVYDRILERYQYLIDFCNKKVELNVMSFNDLVRIKSEFVSIQTEAYQNKNEIINTRADLNTLLNLDPETNIVTSERNSTVSDSLSAGDVVGMASTFRPDYQMAQKNITYCEEAIRFQKSLAAPMTKIGYQPRDRGSNYVRPYAGLVFEITLPIFDRNQAGVQRAKIEYDQANVLLQQFEVEMDNDVTAAYFQFLNNQTVMENYTPEFRTQLDNLSAGAMENFQKQNITLLEFLDYQQTYLESEMQYLDIKSNYYYSLDYLSFSIGRDVTSSSN